MSFNYPDYLQWLAILPVLVFVYIVRVHFRKKTAKKWLGSQGNFLRASISEKKRYAQMTLRICILALLFIALSRPQSAGEKIETRNKGVYILLLVDVSNSMLAEDIKPSRLTFMKKEISRLIDRSSGDQIALAVFARSALLASPFTKDLSAVKSYLNDLSTDYLTNQGTNFEKAFQLSARVFKTIKENKTDLAVKAIVIASDGEDHSKETKKAIKSLVAQKDIRVFALSFGTKEGGVIPIRDYKNQVKEYKKDINGNLVITRLKADSLKNFAKWGRGSYYHVTYSGQAIKRLRQDLNHLEKTLIEKTAFTKKKENYQWFLALAFLLGLIELILNDRSYKKDYFKKGIVG